MIICFKPVCNNKIFINKKHEEKKDNNFLNLNNNQNIKPVIRKPRNNKIYTNIVNLKLDKQSIKSVNVNLECAFKIKGKVDVSIISINNIKKENNEIVFNTTDINNPHKTITYKFKLKPPTDNKTYYAKFSSSNIQNKTPRIYNITYKS